MGFYHPTEHAPNPFAPPTARQWQSPAASGRARRSGLAARRHRPSTSKPGGLASRRLAVLRNSSASIIARGPRSVTCGASGSVPTRPMSTRPLASSIACSLRSVRSSATISGPPRNRSGANRVAALSSNSCVATSGDQIGALRPCIARIFPRADQRRRRGTGCARSRSQTGSLAVHSFPPAVRAAALLSGSAKTRFWRQVRGPAVIAPRPWALRASVSARSAPPIAAIILPARFTGGCGLRLAGTASYQPR